MTDAWTCVTAILESEPEDWAALHEVFATHGIDGTLIEERPPRISGYCYDPKPEELDGLVTALKGKVTSVHVGEVKSVDWAETWKQFFKPRRIGQRFVVRPTWEDYASKPGDLVITLDPGQAFGTGDHPTTRTCLMLLEETPLAGRTLADIGCGSGILTVGAKLLGAGPCVGVDVERASVESSIENVERNGVEAQFFEGLGFAPLPADACYDIVLSNIISAALIALAPEVGKRTHSGAQWIVSGIIHSNWPDVLEAAERHGFQLVAKLDEGDWTAARLVKA